MGWGRLLSRRQSGHACLAGPRRGLPTHPQARAPRNLASGGRSTVSAVVHQGRDVSRACLACFLAPTGIRVDVGKTGPLTRRSARFLRLDRDNPDRRPPPPMRTGSSPHGLGDLALVRSEACLRARSCSPDRAEAVSSSAHLSTLLPVARGAVQPSPPAERVPEKSGARADTRSPLIASSHVTMGIARWRPLTRAYSAACRYNL